MTRVAAPANGTATDVVAVDGDNHRAFAPLLLAPHDVEYELRRLVKRLIAGSKLLRRTRIGPGDPPAERDLLLDVEVDGVRCVLTMRRHAGASRVARLTVREREIAHMVALGLTNVAIAGQLEVSPWTVSTHLRRIFAKLNVPTRAAMVAVIADAGHSDPVASPAEPGS